jgi:hypothetical protein
MRTVSATNQGTPQQRPVKGWVRALAWVIVLASVISLGGLIYLFIARGVWPSTGWPGIFRILLVAAVIWLWPLFAFVAIKGRAPRSWPGLGSATRHRP